MVRTRGVAWGVALPQLGIKLHEDTFAREDNFARDILFYFFLNLEK